MRVTTNAVPTTPAGEHTDAAPARLGQVAALAGAAMVLALAAQGMLNRRLTSPDAFYLLLCALALFIAAFPRVGTAPQRRWLALIVRLALVALAMLVFARAFGNLLRGRDFVVSVALMFLPLPLLGLAFAGERVSSAPDSAADGYLDHLWRRLPATAAQSWLDWLCLSGGTALAIVATAYWFKQGRSNEALALNVASLALVGLAVWRMDRGRPIARTTAVETDDPPLLAHVILLSIIVVAATFLRTWQLTTVPYGIWFDEGQTGLEALRIVRGMPFTPMGTFSSSNPSLFFYIIAFTFKLIGPTLLAVRLVQAITGIATVAIFYPFLRTILGWRAAVVGAFLLGVSSWHVNWSRFGMPYSIGAPLFEVASAYVLVLALRTGRLKTFALAGVAIGLGLYTYFGFRLFPFAILAYLIYGLVLNKERVRQTIAGLLIYALAALIVALPLLTWAWGNRTEFMARTAQTSVFAGKNTPQERMAALENSLRRHILMLNYIGDGNGRHGIPGAPAVDFLSGALLLVGLGYALYRWRSPSYMLLLLWFVIGMMAGVMSLDWEAPQQHRTLVAIPAVYGLAAVVGGKVWQGWDRLAASASSVLKRRIALAFGVAGVGVILAAVGYVNYDRYFNQQMKRSDVYYAFSAIETTVARRVADLGVAGYRYYIQVQGAPAFSFLVGGDTPDRPVDSVFFRAYAHMPLREPISKTAVFLLEPWRVTIDPSDVLRYYPHAQFVDHKDPFGQSIVYEFMVPADDVNNLLGLRGRYFAGDQPEGTPELERVDKQVVFDWSSQAPLDGSFNVEWSGSIVPPDAGAYTLELDTDGAARISVDGNWLDFGQSKTARLHLAKGMHPVVVQFRGKKIQLIWTPPNGKREVIPTSAMLATGLPENGLLGNYYRSEFWQGQPEFTQVDPYLAFRWHPEPIEPTPWSAIWTGKIEIPVAGRYLFQGVCNDRIWLLLDGKTLLDGSAGVREVEVNLTEGRHDIQVKYANKKGYAELRFSWRTPDGKFEVVPNRYLFTK